MKKFAWMLAMVLPMGLAFTSCGEDDNEGLTLDKTSVEVDYQKDVTLKASEGKCTWTSSNDFVASVDKDGKVVANHVGEAIITATKDGEAATCKVVVKATDNAYVMPVTAWGESMANVENAMGDAYVKNTAASDAESLFFGTKTDLGFPWYIYIFENGKLTSSSLTVELDDELKAVDTMADYLEQRFKLIEFNETTMVSTYANAETVATATNIVRVQPSDDLETYMAVFTANTDTKAGAVEARIARMVKKVNSINK